MSNQAPEQTLYRSGELAELAGVSTDTLRHYERIGLLPPPERAENGYRQYSSTALDRVRLIRSALAIDFSLKELIVILRTRDDGGAPCREVRELAARKLQDLEERIREMQAMKESLMHLLAVWDARLSGTAPHMRAALLESLTAQPPPQSAVGRPLRKAKKGTP